MSKGVKQIALSGLLAGVIASCFGAGMEMVGEMNRGGSEAGHSGSGGGQGSSVGSGGSSRPEDAGLMNRFLDAMESDAVAQTSCGTCNGAGVALTVVPSEDASRLVRGTITSPVSTLAKGPLVLTDAETTEFNGNATAKVANLYIAANCFVLLDKMNWIGSVTTRAGGIPDKAIHGARIVVKEGQSLCWSGGTESLSWSGFLPY